MTRAQLGTLPVGPLPYAWLHSVNPADLALTRDKLNFSVLGFRHIVCTLWIGWYYHFITLIISSLLSQYEINNFSHSLLFSLHGTRMTLKAARYQLQDCNRSCFESSATRFATLTCFKYDIRLMIYNLLDKLHPTHWYSCFSSSFVYVPNVETYRFLVLHAPDACMWHYRNDPCGSMDDMRLYFMHITSSLVRCQWPSSSQQYFVILKSPQ